MVYRLKYFIRSTLFIRSCIVLFGCLFLNSCNAYYNLFYTDPKKCFEECIIKKPYDVVIVPGFPYDSTSMNKVLEQRIKWAYFLYKKGYTKNIIFSGSAVHSPYVEAEIMRLYALQLGVKEENIFTETKAEHSTENLYNSYVMAKDAGFNTIAFASHPAQTSFMKPFKRKFKLDIDFIPVIEDSLQSLNVNLKSLDVKPLFIPEFIALKERESLLKSLRGTRGHNVKVAIRKAKKLDRKKNKQSI